MNKDKERDKLNADLSVALFKGDFEEAEELVKKGADFDSMFVNGEFFLYIDDNLDYYIKKFKFALNNLSDVNLQDKEGYTLLDYLLMWGAHLECIYATLAKGGVIGRRDIFRWMGYSHDIMRDSHLLKEFIEGNWGNND